MPKSSNNIITDLHDLLKTKGFDPKTTVSGKSSITPQNASMIEFSFKDGNTDYGTSRIIVDSAREMILFFNKSIAKKAKYAWSEFISEIKNWSFRNGILKFNLEPIDDYNEYLERRRDASRINENYYGTKYTSYSDKTPKTVKLIIKHNKSLEETDKRYRHVDKIFVENELGERFILPTKKPGVGYVYARLIADGGNPYDERGKHIAELSEDISRLAGFVRATKSNQFNESIRSMINEAVQQYHALREVLEKLKTARGFRTYFENWTPTLTEKSDLSVLESMFKHSIIDPRIEKALPVLSKFKINISEIEESSEFENWAEGFIHEELDPSLPSQSDELIRLLGKDSDPIPLGPDASNVLGMLEDIIQDDELTRRLIKAAEADPNNDARSIIKGWISEHSDDSDYKEILNAIQDENNDQSSEPESEPEPELKSEPESEPELNSSEQKPLPLPTKPLSEFDEIHRLRKLSGMK